MARAIGLIPSKASRGDLASFTALWDEHRRPVSFGETGVWISAGALVLAAIWLIGETRRRRMVDASRDGSLPPDSIFLLRFVLIAGALAMGSVALSAVPPERVPAGILILMPTRLLNVNVLMLTAVVFGLAGACRPWWCGPWMGLALATLLMVGSRSLLWDFARARGWTVTPPAIDSLVILAVGAALVGLGGLITSPRLPDRAARRETRRGRLILNLARLSLVAIIMWIAAGPIRAERKRREFRNQSDALVFSRAARGTGFLLTGGDLELIQVRTRRPLLINSGALDTVAYAPESAPALRRILLDVYGIDLFDPPPGTPKKAVVPEDHNRAVWERYSLERWQEIKNAYGVTQVLVPSDWALALPSVVGQRGHLLLYDIP